MDRTERFDENNYEFNLNSKIKVMCLTITIHHTAKWTSNSIVKERGLWWPPLMLTYISISGGHCRNGEAKASRLY